MFMQQVVRSRTTTDEGFLVAHRALVGDCDGKWGHDIASDSATPAYA